MAIVVVFILCHSVKWIPNLYELSRLAREDKRAWPPWVESVTHISHFLMTVNSSVNFYIYCVKHYGGGWKRRLRRLVGLAPADDSLDDDANFSMAAVGGRRSTVRRDTEIACR